MDTHHINATFLLTIKKIWHLPDHFCEEDTFQKVKLSIVVGDKKHKVDELAPVDASLSPATLRFSHPSKIACSLYYKNGPGTTLREKILKFTLHPPKGKPIKWKCNVSEYYDRVLATKETLYTHKLVGGVKPQLEFCIEDKSKDPLFLYKKTNPADMLQPVDEFAASASELDASGQDFQRRESVRNLKVGEHTKRLPSMRLVAGEHLGVASKRRSVVVEAPELYDEDPTPPSPEPIRTRQPQERFDTAPSLNESKPAPVEETKPPQTSIVTASAPQAEAAPKATVTPGPIAPTSQKEETRPLLQTTAYEKPAKRGCLCC